jgi:hypothetical protein
MSIASTISYPDFLETYLFKHAHVGGRLRLDQAYGVRTACCGTNPIGIGSVSGSQSGMAVKDYAERFYRLGKVDFVYATWTWHLEENQQDTISGLLEQLYL